MMLQTVPTTIIPAPQIDEETINIDGKVLLRGREKALHFFLHYFLLS